MPQPSPVSSVLDAQAAWHRCVRTAAGIELALLAAVPYSASDPKTTAALGIALERQRGVHAIGGERRVDFDTWPGTVAATPAGLDLFSESAHGGEYLVVRWEPQAAEFAPPGASHCREWRGDAQAVQLAVEIRRELLVEPNDPARLQDLALAFLARGTTDASAASTRRPLEASACAQALERIEQQFDTPLTLEVLALDAGLGPVAFLRGFAAVVGQTPHAYLTARRVAAARRLLATTARPLAEIALDCGFAHQSHLGAAFRRLLGMTPGAYRRLSRGGP